MLDHKGRINSATLAVERYHAELSRGDRAFFSEEEVCYYWDDASRSEAGGPLNFLCADWKDFIARYSPHAFMRSWGADCRGWPGGNGFNSAGLFGQFLQYHELSIREQIEVLIEICRVRECEWAREMLKGFLRNFRLEDDDGTLFDRPIRHQGDLALISQKLSDYFERVAEYEASDA